MDSFDIPFSSTSVCILLLEYVLLVFSSTISSLQRRFYADLQYNCCDVVFCCCKRCKCRCYVLKVTATLPMSLPIKIIQISFIGILIRIFYYFFFLAFLTTATWNCEVIFGSAIKRTSSSTWFCWDLYVDVEDFKQTIEVISWLYTLNLDISWCLNYNGIRSWSLI